MTSQNSPTSSLSNAIESLTVSTNTEFCPICQSPMNANDEQETLRVYSTTLCNHTFHDVCLTEWRNSPRSNAIFCPVCRAYLATGQPGPQLARIRNSTPPPPVTDMDEEIDVGNETENNNREQTENNNREQTENNNGEQTGNNNREETGNNNAEETEENNEDENHYDVDLSMYTPPQLERIVEEPHPDFCHFKCNTKRQCQNPINMECHIFCRKHYNMIHSIEDINTLHKMKRVSKAISSRNSTLRKIEEERIKNEQLIQHHQNRFRNNITVRVANRSQSHQIANSAIAEALPNSNLRV